MYTYGRLTLMCGGNQHNIVKQSSFKKKYIKKKKLAMKIFSSLCTPLDIHVLI